MIEMFKLGGFGMWLTLFPGLALIGAAVAAHSPALLPEAA